MAPVSANAAGCAQKQARRVVPRIVPAIPHRLARAPPAARPMTPEESNKGTAVAQREQREQREPEPEPAPQVVEKQQDQQDQQDPQDPQAEAHAKKLSVQQRPSSAVERPPTPDSRASVADKSEVGGPVLAHSPPASQDELRDDTRPASNGATRRLPVPASFFPSSQTDTSANNAQDGATAHARLHRHQLSAGAIEFHSANESPVVPATPQDPEQYFHATQTSLPHHPPGFAPPQFASFFPGQSHHPSDVGSSWLQNPYPAVPSDVAHENGDGHKSPPFALGLHADASLFNGHHPHADASFAANGTAGSPTRSPNKPQSGDTLAVAEPATDERHTALHQNGTAPLAERFDESPFELAAYLSTQFGNPEFSDFVLQLRSTEFAHVSIPVHGIVVVRSPVIAEAICHSPAPSHHSRDVRKLVDISVSDPFATRESLEEAIKILYGAPLLSASNFLYGLGSYTYESDQTSPSSDAQRRMQQILSYIAAARTLQMPGMQARGVEIARLLIRWDTVDQVLQYGLQAGSESWSRMDTQVADDPFIAALLNYAVEFMAYTFPVKFKLHTIAPEFKDVPRLPVTVMSRPSTHNSRLSKIRFGDASPEDVIEPNYTTKVLSTVLLSLPLSILERLFSHRATANQIGWTGVAGVMRDVIRERESRRQRVLQGQLRPVQNGSLPAALLNNMYLEERVEQLEPSPLHPSGYKLAATRMSDDA